MKSNKNGVKLLAAVMVFAMAFAGVVVVLSDNDSVADPISISDSAGLKNAIAGQADGQVWNITASIQLSEEWSFNVDKDEKTVTLKMDAEGYVFPIVKNNITINCAEGVTINDTRTSGTGNVSNQNIITVWGDGFTLKGATIVDSGTYVNKAVEIYGSGSTIENCVFGTEDGSAGSILYNGDATDSTIRNVTINQETVKSWRAAENVMTIENVTINLDEFTYTPGTFGSEGSTYSGLTLNIGRGTIKSFESIETGTAVTINEAYTFPAGATVNVSGEVGFDVPVTIPAKTNLTNTGKITINETLTNEGTFVLGQSATMDNNGTYVAAPGSTNPDFSKIGGTITSDMMGLENTINADTKIDGEAYLRNDLVIPAGKTLTISNSGSLEMQGHKITVYGTLVIDTRGAVIGEGRIELMKDGVIDNSGLIGKSGAVTIAAGTLEDKYTGAGSVAIQNVSGIEFGLKKTDATHYVLTISGEASKKTDTSNPVYEVTSTGAYVDSDFQIRSDVTLKGSITVSKGTLTINGIYDDENGVITMMKGAVLDITGKFTDGKIQAGTGEYISSGSASSLGTTEIVAKDVTGMTVEVTSVSYTKDVGNTPTSYTEQRLVLSGDIKCSEKTGKADIDVNKLNGTTNSSYFGVYVIDEVSLNNCSFSVDGSSYVTVLGKVTSEFSGPYSSFDNLGSRVIGAIYQTEVKSESGSKTYVVTMQPFDAAFAAIDGAYEKTIYVYGDVEVSDVLEIKDGWIIDGEGVYSITSTGSVTVADGAELNAKAGNVYENNKQVAGIVVDGILLVKDGGYVEGNIEYSAKTTDAETGDVTYSGFLVALNNAPEGATVEVSKKTVVKESFTIPANKTVKVKDGVTLTAQKSMTVEGTLVSEGTVTVGEKTIVSGKVDFTESEYTLTGDITVTGEIVLANEYSGEKMNAVWFLNDDNQYVYTTLSNAVDALSKIDATDKTITQVGKVTDSTAVTLENMTLAITGEAVFGEITLEKSTVTAAGTTNVKLTATIIGSYGEDGSQAETKLVLREVYRGATFTSNSQANEMNVQVWSTTFVYGDGSVTIDAGQAETSVSGTVGFNTTALKVSSGATLVMKNPTVGGTVTVNQAKNLVIEGTAIVDGNVTISANDFVVAGNLVINTKKTLAVTGTMTVEGTLTVSEKDDRKATFTVDDGRVNVGAVPKTLGDANGAITGTVNITGTGYVVVYSGASVDADKIVENNVAEKPTAFSVNGIDYATVYGNTGIRSLDKEIKALKDLDQTVTQEVGYYIPWSSGETDIPNNDSTPIGEFNAVSAKIAWAAIDVTISAGPGLEIYIDDVYMNGDMHLSVGDHTITVYVKSGYEGTPKVTFNGQEIANGKFTLTSAAIGEKNVVYATGATPIDYSQGGSSTGSSSDDGMSVTDYLLIVLVVLIVIMAVLVAIRMMRS